MPIYDPSNSDSVIASDPSPGSRVGPVLSSLKSSSAMQTNKRLFTVNVTSYPAIGFSGSTERVILKVPPNSEVLSKNVPNISMNDFIIYVLVNTIIMAENKK